MSPANRFEDIAYEQLVTDGINAAKAGLREQARKYLERAARYRKPDARPWIWLSATTDDPAEQKKYLEYAVAADPSNTAARRGLVMLSGKLDRDRVLPVGEGVEPRRPQEPEDSRAEPVQCPKCGGKMDFNPSGAGLVCQYCGHTQPVETRAAGEEAEQVLDFTLPTTRGHRWAEAQQRFTCSRCGAVTLSPPGEKTGECPYCGSNHLLTSAEAVELIDPQVIGLMKIDARQAVEAARKWLGTGLFVPDDLHKGASRLHLRPAYYPFWTFDGTLEIPWSCEVNVGSRRSPRWVSRSGTEIEMFDDVLVSGLKNLPDSLVAEVEPFMLKEVVEFRDELLTGWAALGYDKAMAEASLEARQKMVTRVRRSLDSQVEPGKEKRGMRTGSGNWSGLTYKHVLLPLWVGTYEYAGKSYSLLINGQTGKVAGEKPKDRLKIGLMAAAAVIVLIVVGLLLFMAFR